MGYSSSIYLNEGEIQMYLERHARDPVLYRAARYLDAYKDMINANSDGWAYWRTGRRAAARLMHFVQEGVSDEKLFKQALVPMKSLCTRKGLPFPELPD